MSVSFLDRLLDTLSQLESRAVESRTEIGRLKALVNVVEAKNGQYEVELSSIRALIAGEQGRQGEIKGNDGNGVEDDDGHPLAVEDGSPGIVHLPRGEFSTGPLGQSIRLGIAQSRAQSRRVVRVSPMGSPALIPPVKVEESMNNAPVQLLSLPNNGTAAYVKGEQRPKYSYARRGRTLAGRRPLMPTRLYNSELLHTSSSAGTPQTFHGNIQQACSSSVPEDQPYEAAKSPTLPSSQSIEDTIASLPPASESQIPYPPVHFTNAFLEKALRTGSAGFTKIGAERVQEQIHPCPALIKIGSEPLNQFTPLPGQHGAVMFVQDQPGSGEIGDQYTVFRKTDKAWEYCGEYRLIQRLTVPLQFWAMYPDRSKCEIATKINTTMWGQQLLEDNEVVDEEYFGKPGTVREILAAFTREQNCLRMAWGILQFVEYKRDFYDDLVNAFAKCIAAPQASRKRSSTQIRRCSDTPDDPAASHVTHDVSSTSVLLQQGHEDGGVPVPNNTQNSNGTHYENDEDAEPTDGRRKRARLSDRQEASSARRRTDERGIRYNLDGAQDSSEY